MNYFLLKCSLLMPQHRAHFTIETIFIRSDIPHVSHTALLLLWLSGANLIVLVMAQLRLPVILKEYLELALLFKCKCGDEWGLALLDSDSRRTFSPSPFGPPTIFDPSSARSSKRALFMRLD